MQPSKADDLPVGRRLTRLRRAVFVRGAEVRDAGGDLEASFDDGQVFCLRVAGDGDSLEIQPWPWPEQFPEPVSQENRAFLQSSGKWEMIDAGETFWSYRQFLGHQLSRVEMIGRSELLLDFEGMHIRIQVVADELRVHFQAN